jgi:replicative DNA helicase
LNYGQMLLSKVIDNNDVNALKRFGIDADHFETAGERETYRFIVDYAERNRGQAPDFRTVVAECQAFDYQPNVEDSYEFLARQIKDRAAKRMFNDLVASNDLDANFQKDFESFAKWLTESVESIKIRTSVRNKIGTDLKTVGEQFLAEYERRKAGDSFRVWKSKFSVIGNYTSGNMYVVYGKSGRGKSVTSLEDAVEMALQGANVLIWSMEMSWFEVWVRLFVSMSGRKGLTTAEFNGMDLDAGFNADELRKGQLSPEFETAFRFFVDTVNDEIPGNIIVRAVDDDEFVGRSIRDLEADILATKADVVIIDPFYYLDYERNSSKTAGGDAAETSKKLRRLTGRLGVVTIAITQADEKQENKDDDGNRELKLPEREDVKKTKQLLEDAYMLIAVDTDYKQGRGLIGINKGRDGGEGTSTEIIYIPQVGVVRELDAAEELAKHFDF